MLNFLESTIHSIAPLKSYNDTPAMPLSRKYTYVGAHGPIRLRCQTPSHSDANEPNTAVEKISKAMTRLNNREDDRPAQ
jgi:hypothetical protein